MDISSIDIECDLHKIYQYMSNITNINEWSIGIHWDITNDKIVQGISSYDDSISYLKIVKNDKIKKVDYWIGEDISDLVPRIYIRVLPTEDKKRNKLKMVAFRSDNMDDERWKRLKDAHQSELITIREILCSK